MIFAASSKPTFVDTTGLNPMFRIRANLEDPERELVDSLRGPLVSPELLMPPTLPSVRLAASLGETTT